MGLQSIWAIRATVLLKSSVTSTATACTLIPQNQVSGVPASWPRVDLQVGSRGNNVRVIQEQLNAIARNYPAIPTVTVDGIFGPETRAAVQKFQSVFNLPASGVVDYPTWYKISEIYVAVTRIAELYQ